jgi:hypothetical protein
MSGPVKLSVGKMALSMPANQAQGGNVLTPKVHYLPPTSGQSQSAWNTAGAFLDYTLPKSLSVLNNLKLRFQVTNGGSADVPAPPTPFWVQQVEVYIGGAQIEVLYPNDLFNEAIGFRTYEELTSEGKLYATAPEDTYESSFNTIKGTGATIVPDEERMLATVVETRPPPATFNPQTFFYLPLPNCLTTARLYVAGVMEDVRFRVYFPPNLFPTGSTGITCTSCTMVIEEDCCAPEEIAKYESAHREGIVYNTVVRQRQTQTITKSGTSDNTVELTGLSGASAGLICYAGPAVVPGQGEVGDITKVDLSGATVMVNQNNLLWNRYNITTSLELNDAMGAKRTEELRTDDLSTRTWFDHVGTDFGSRFNTYLIPFSSSFRSAVENGVNQGFLNLRGNDRLVIRGNPNTRSVEDQTAYPYSSSAVETWALNVVSYVYQALVFKGRSLTNVIRKVNQTA